MFSTKINKKKTNNKQNKIMKQIKHKTKTNKKERNTENKT